MNRHVLPDDFQERSSLSEAVSVLGNGGIGIFPTDTAYAIGCRVDSPKSLERLFRIRRRARTHATPVLVSSVSMARHYFRSPLPSNVRRLMNDYWPGALTVIFPCCIDRVASLPRGGGDTLGIRMPDSRIAQFLISSVGVPLLGPSANFHTYPTPFSFDQLDPTLISLVDFVIKGSCPLRSVSTVIDCSRTPWKIVRRGHLSVNLSAYRSGRKERP